MRPYFLQPNKVLPFLSLKKQEWPKEITREYFLSFEDALWDLLPRLGYKKGAKFLVPDFYCVDVINNIIDHGYNVSYYKLNEDLSINEDTLIVSITSEKPDIFVDFKIAGIATNLPERILKKLPFYTLVITDKVHSLVGSSVDNYPVSDKHLILTSNRKVSPFPGSVAIYTRNARISSSHLPIRYVLTAFVFWMKYLFVLRIASLFGIVKLAVYAEKLLKKHDDLIGDAKTSAPLSKIWFSLFDRINITKIEEKKLQDYQTYNSVLHPILESTSIAWTIPNVDEFAEKLRGFPLIIQSKYANRFLKECREMGVLTVSQLDDSPWANGQKLFLLPMGIQLSNKSVKNIAIIAQEALTRAIQYDTITA